jgi:glutathione peroxidase
MSEIYDIDVQRPNGKSLSLETYKGKVLLIVNTATECGLATQFKPLEELYQEFKDDGLIVLGFPCNQFGGQEPVTDEEMTSTCEINFGVTFPLFKKIDVNGKNAHSLFQYLKKSLPGFLTNDIKWNFTKFLVDHEGNPVKRFAPTDQPSEIRRHVVKLLNNVKK